MRISVTYPAVALAFAGLLQGLVFAQPLTTLHSFPASPHGTNIDGFNTLGGLVLEGNTLYGTATSGGNAGYGTVYSLKTDGTAFKVLHTFTTPTGHFPETNNDGANPQPTLLLSSGTLYGATSAGGAGGVGTVYKLNIDGSGFVPLHSFWYPLIPNADGHFPDAMFLAGDTLYGLTDGGGYNDNGTVFQINTDGSGFVSLFSFDFAPPGQAWLWGASRKLILSGDTLYGTTGGSYDLVNGTVFAVNRDGSGFAVLHQFTGGEDGKVAMNLVLSGNTLYGVALSAGGTGMGALFRLATDGSDFTVLHSFTHGSDGGVPQGLVLSGTTLYGTAGAGGDSDLGTIYSVNSDGTGFKTLYSFAGGMDGGNPRAGLIFSNGTLYGTTGSGGSSTNGTVFSFPVSGQDTSSATQLRLAASGPNFVLTWPATASGFDLQSTTGLGTAADWKTFSPETPRVVVDGQYTVTITNAFTDSQRYFRLSK